MNEFLVSQIVLDPDGRTAVVTEIGDGCIALQLLDPEADLMLDFPVPGRPIAWHPPALCSPVLEEGAFAFWL